MAIRFNRVTKRFPDGTTAVRELTLDIDEGEFMILVGPSGCGKTTALRMVAGLEEVTEGEIELGGQVVNAVEPGDRDVAMVFQNYALFPHMTVRQNIAFPLRMRRVPLSQIDERVRETSELLGLGMLLDRKPNELSGGQRQRVAMGRAIVRHPRVFLLDEPLSNLDAKLRTQMRAELSKLHGRLGVTTLYVTHDQVEAMTLGSRVAVLRDGVVQQVGTPQDLYHRPANAFVARFVGSPNMNMLHGELHGGRLELPGAVARIDLSDRLTGSRDVLVGFRPEAMRVGALPDRDDGLGIAGAVEVVEDLGSELVVYVAHDAGEVAAPVDEEETPMATLVARVDVAQSVRRGARVQFHLAPDELHVFDAATGEALLSPLRPTAAVLA